MEPKELGPVVWEILEGDMSDLREGLLGCLIACLLPVGRVSISEPARSTHE